MKTYQNTRELSIKMDEIDAQNSNEMEIEPDVEDEESSVFEILTAAQIESKMNQCIDEAIGMIKPNVLVSWIAFLPFCLRW